MSNEKQVTEKKTSSLEGVICSNPGTHIVPVFKRVFDDDANRFLVKKTGEMDIYEFIQASRSATDLAALEKRFIATGEIPAVDPSMVADGVDFTQMPKDIHEAYSMMNDIDNSFSKLPESVQALFGSKEAYMQAAINGTIQSTLISALSKQKVPADTSVTEEKVGE